MLLSRLRTGLRSNLALRTFATERPQWMIDAEREARSAVEARADVGGGTPGDVMMGKVAKEFQAEGASLAVKQEDKLKEVMKKMNKVSGNALMFNTLRKKAIEVRQNIITQRELAGLAKDATLSRKVIEDLFPIPAPR
jgi:hypothetical protein